MYQCTMTFSDPCQPIRANCGALPKHRGVQGHAVHHIHVNVRHDYVEHLAPLQPVERPHAVGLALHLDTVAER